MWDTTVTMGLSSGMSDLPKAQYDVVAKFYLILIVTQLLYKNAAYLV